jgi:hypothetical protein
MGLDISFARPNEDGLLEHNVTGYRARCIGEFEILYTHMTGKEFFMYCLGENYYDYEYDAYCFDQKDEVKQKFKDEYKRICDNVDLKQVCEEINNITVQDIEKYIEDHGGADNTDDKLIDKFELFEDDTNVTIKSLLEDYKDTINELLNIIENGNWYFYHLG